MLSAFMMHHPAHKQHCRTSMYESAPFGDLSIACCSFPRTYCFRLSKSGTTCFCWGVPASAIIPVYGAATQATPQQKFFVCICGCVLVLCVVCVFFPPILQSGCVCVCLCVCVCFYFLIFFLNSNQHGPCVLEQGNNQCTRKDGESDHRSRKRKHSQPSRGIQGIQGSNSERRKQS